MNGPLIRGELMWIKSFRLRRRTIAIALACILVLVAATTFVFLNDEKESVISVAKLRESLSKAVPESMRLAPDLEKSIEERLKRGQYTFRYDTFGDEAFWGIPFSSIGRSPGKSWAG